ncbi:MAG: hypothetical protein L0332_25985 [Chloroflexi bacterium]|nr:hypothetical protein [Chloroflexota bacterium]MCI0577265.1 hypothetical protein [Chloroflexota bacterium]MCI0648210.1 hypothetical protein [Chloroflexota bacterium]MCI0730149.1 hypothetical protein [Chloroflexota bacterium]
MKAARRFKIIVEKHPDGYIAYPLGLKGVAIGEGDTYEEALAMELFCSLTDMVLSIRPEVVELRDAQPAQGRILVLAKKRAAGRDIDLEAVRLLELKGNDG